MDSNSSLNATRPRWGETTDSFNSQWRDNWTSAAHTATVQDQERVINNVTDHQNSRPIDFIKLVGLWADVNQQHEGSLDAFRVEGPISFSAAKTLGRGLSFDVILIPVEDRTKQQLQLRSPFVVYKKLRGLTDTLDTIEKGGLLRAMLLEVRVLTHPPLKNHPNIIRLLQLIWEPDPDLLDHAWPIIVLEHAENGTLADFQIDYPDLPFSFRKQLCVDVGNGLLALHATSIVHGDLKSENVLICDTGHKGRVVAKLADFGCAITDLQTSDTLKLPAFTMPWNAPECHDRLPRDFLQYSDVYSYGLLIWRTTLGGFNPFRLIDGLAALETADFQREVEQRKMQGHIIPMAKSTLRPPFCNPGTENYLISSALELTLRLDALTRDLPGSLKLLSEQGVVSAYPEEPLMQYKYENLNISLPTSAMIPVALQLSVIRELEALSVTPGSLGGSVCLKLFEIYLDRLEWPGAAENAAKWYLKATEKGPAESIVGYAEGAFELLQYPVPAGIGHLGALKTCGSKGCYHSLMELRRRSPPDFPDTQQNYRLLGGVQRRSEKHKIFDLHLFSDFEEYFNDIESKSTSLDQTLVSENGDLPLHVAARHGCARAMDKLLSLGTNIDSTNRDGETALFQACRIGSLEATEFLLSRGANMALAANNGETPLHWLFAFDDHEIERAGQLLISDGGQPCLFAAVGTGYSSAVESLSLHGTPLHYAILARNEKAAQALLGLGADPFIGYEDELSSEPFTFTPFRLALLELLPSVIKIMINLPIFARTFQSYWRPQEEALFHSTVQGSSTLFRRLTLGAQYTRILIEVVDLLRAVERREKHNSKTPQKSETSLLHTCILHGIPVEVIEHLLKTGCKEDMELISGLHRHTPLQAAMYLNRRKAFLLLLSYGADIHRLLQSPPGYSYVQYCVYLGANAVFFANELISRGAVLRGRSPDILTDSVKPCGYPPVFLAIIMGNFELATMFLIKSEKSPYVVPRWKNVFDELFYFLPRLPVSRLRYLLEPPEGFESIALGEFKLSAGRNCFHTLASWSAEGDLEMLVNFRYLFQQSICRGQKGLLNELDVHEFSPLTIAATRGRIELVQEMMYAGANPNIGGMTSVNWVYLYLKRLQKAPTQPLTPNSTKLSRREARWLQEDYKSIIKLLKQYGGQELRNSSGRIDVPIEYILSFPLKAYQQRSTEARQLGFELGKEAALQDGFSYHSLHQVVATLKGDVHWNFVDSSSDASHDPLSPLYQAFQNLYKEYQSDREVQSRFSNRDHASSSRLADNSSKLGELEDSIMGKIKTLVGFVKWTTRPPAQEIKEPYPSHSASISLPSQPCAAPGVFSPIETEQQLSLAQNPITDSQQTTSGTGTPEFHIHALSQQLSPILSSYASYASDPNRLRFCVQQCFDIYFPQAGTGAFTPDAKILTGAPLGSLFVLELENGLNNLLRGRFHVMILKRGELLKAVIHSIGQTPDVIADSAENLALEGWMGWRELEEKEAEILLDTFSQQCEVGRES